MVDQITDNFWRAEAGSEETEKFIKYIKRIIGQWLCLSFIIS